MWREQLQVNFAFPLIKIEIQRSCNCTINKYASSRQSSCKYASSKHVKLVAGMYFRFSDRKNRNVGATAVEVPTTCAKPVTNRYFRFSNRKNCNAGAAMPAIGALLFNTSLVVFAFLIANARIVVTGVLSWLHELVFVFLFVKIVTRRQLCLQQSLFYLIHL